MALGPCIGRVSVTIEPFFFALAPVAFLITSAQLLDKGERQPNQRNGDRNYAQIERERAHDTFPEMLHPKLRSSLFTPRAHLGHAHDGEYLQPRREFPATVKDHRRR